METILLSPKETINEAPQQKHHKYINMTFCV